MHYRLSLSEFFHNRFHPMRFGYTIIYVSDVQASMRFFEAAFGLAQRFYHESGYGEMETGQTALAFASHDLGRSNLPAGYIQADQSPQPLGVEIALVTEDVRAAHDKAVKAGAVSLKQPMGTNRVLCPLPRRHIGRAVLADWCLISGRRPNGKIPALPGPRLSHP